MENNRILIIEDDKSIAELVRDYLEIDGFVCEMAHRGDEGLTLALTREYDLIIIDIMLPGRDGFEICSSFRKHSDKPVLFLSAKKEDIDKVRGLGLGADDYVTKPFAPSELVARVKAHIGRYVTLSEKSPASKKCISVRGLVIDLDARRVTVDGREVVMPAKEYDLLLYLAQNPDRVMSKEHLFDRVWGMDALGDISTVTVHIQRIRDKIENTESGNKYIETVWGAGYRFKV